MRGLQSNLVYNIFCILLGSIPRYVRINRIKTSMKAVIQDFKQNDYQLVEPQNISSFATKVNVPLIFTLTFLRKILFCQWHKLFSKKIQSSPEESNIWPSAHWSDTLPLSYRRLVGVLTLSLPESNLESINVVVPFVWVCGWNPSVWPFKWKLLSSTFKWYCLFLTILQNEIQFFLSFELGLLAITIGSNVTLILPAYCLEIDLLRSENVWKKWSWYISS